MFPTEAARFSTAKEVAESKIETRELEPEIEKWTARVGNWEPSGGSRGMESGVRDGR